MKRKLSKKVLCLCMVAVLAIGLAVPAFAAQFPTRFVTVSGSNVVALEIFLVSDTNQALNIYGSAPSNYADVTTYKRTNDYATQRWAVYYGIDGINTIRTASNLLYGLGIYGDTCAVFDLTKASQDGIEIREPYSQETSPGYYAWSFDLKSSGRTLNVAGPKYGTIRDVTWSNEDRPTYQIWHVENR